MEQAPTSNTTKCQAPRTSAQFCTPVSALYEAYSSRLACCRGFSSCMDNPSYKLLAGKHRRTFFQESAHAFVVVGAPAGNLLHVSFVVEIGFQILQVGVV